MKLLGTPEAVFIGLLCNSTDSSDVKCLCACALDARGGWGGGGGTASLRVGTQNKTTDPQFCATTALSHLYNPCWFTAPCV